MLGAATARALKEAGASVVAAGRSEDRTSAVARDLGTEPLTLDVVDVDACTAVVDAAAEALGGLDALVVATGVAGFGPAVDADAAVVEELFAVNTLGPMALVRAATRHLPEKGGYVAVLSAILADLPTNGMADYGATKAALASWLQVLRRENRRRFGVLDLRPPHLDTGLAERALVGEPPRLPDGMDHARVVEALLQGLREDASEVVWDPDAKDLAVR
ncbi:SDR family NAD(P)-dependent oxidoreductase [Nocardioides lentus]|uniref:SDR family NAD(P)-dependent oxidoreductase n=1 Tax=Nocardioides lentus TaxID=338077 RepID=A0ABP5A940_9ACTN